MAKFYTNLTSGDTVTAIQTNGGEYGISISQDLDCSKVLKILYKYYVIINLLLIIITVKNY